MCGHLHCRCILIKHLQIYLNVINIMENIIFIITLSYLPCISPARTWRYKVPSYVGDSYFCETGALTSTHNDYNKVYLDNPLWDGEGCGGSSTCCSFNNPPWFCQHLNYHMSDNLELRLCSHSNSDHEDKLVSLVEIYVK